MTVGEVTTVGEVHGEDLVTGLENAEVNGHVGLAATVRLDIRVIGPEEFLGAFDGEVLDNVDVFAAAVPSASRVALGILIGEAGALGLHHSLAGEVLRRDQLDVLELAMMLRSDGFGDLRVGLRERAGAIEGGVGVVCFRHGDC